MVDFEVSRRQRALIDGHVQDPYGKDPGLTLQNIDMSVCAERKKRCFKYSTRSRELNTKSTEAIQK